MTRFNIVLQEGVDMVLWALEHGRGGEIFVPKLPSYRIVDVARAIGPDCEHSIVGVRPGEKFHEEMITVGDSYNTVDLGRCFAILPSALERSIESYCEMHNVSRAPLGVSYNSYTNSRFLSVEEIRSLIAEHVEHPRGRPT